jgi:hypothetical protein
VKDDQFRNLPLECNVHRSYIERLPRGPSADKRAAGCSGGSGDRGIDVSVFISRFDDTKTDEDAPEGLPLADLQRR